MTSIDELQKAQATSLSVAKNPRQEIIQALKQRVEDDSVLASAILWYIREGYIKTEDLPLYCDLSLKTMAEENLTDRTKRKNWKQNFEGLFSAFQELSLSAQSKEPSLRKLLEDPALLEKLADLEHEQWSQCVLWMQKSGHAFGTKAQRWVLWRAWDILAHTNYSDLTEKQKESDRKIARKVLEVFDETFTRKVSGVEEK